MTAVSPQSWTTWPDDAKRRLLASLQTERWLKATREPRDRPEQRQPEGGWRVWYVRGGRGSGKTRTGSETLAMWIREWCFREELFDWAIVAPTFGDARNVCMEGPSGLLGALSGVIDRRKDWNRSMGELWLPNGSRVFCDGADDGAYRIQGVNLRGAWCDEVGLWRDWRHAWEESLHFAVRFAPARIIATGTPKAGHPLVKSLLSDPLTSKTHMRTIDNADNLSDLALAAMIAKYGDTRLGRQELEGEFLEDVPGALWSWDMIVHLERPEHVQLDRIVIGVDPAVTSGEDADDTGLIVAGWSKYLNKTWILEDATCHDTPDGWARRAVQLYEDWDADLIVAEANNGGDLVESVIRTVSRNVPYKKVHASRGKRVRAEPIAALYEQERVYHHRPFPELEEQMTTYTVDTDDSPDRLDALVWALTELVVNRQPVLQYSYLTEDVEPVRRTGDLVLVGEKYIDKER